MVISPLPSENSTYVSSNGTSVTAGVKARSFSTEQELIEEVVKNLTFNKGSYLLQEFDSTHGIADLVFARLSNTWKRRVDLSKIPAGYAYALWKIPYRKAFSIELFCSLTSTSKNEALRMLKKFVGCNYLRKNSTTQTWVKVRQPKLVTTEIDAVEAKLSNWKLALQQAVRYLHFAQRAWVWLDAAKSKAAVRNLDEFKRFNIGLGTVNPDGTLQVYYRPVKNQPKSPMIFWMANVKIAANLSVDDCDRID